MTNTPMPHEDTQKQIQALFIGPLPGIRFKRETVN